MKTLYLKDGAPGSLVAIPPVASAGSIFTGEERDYLYPLTPEEMLKAGSIELHVLTNVAVGSNVNLTPVVIITDPEGVEVTIWAGAQQLATPGGTLSWTSTYQYNGYLGTNRLRLKLIATGTTGQSATLGIGADNRFVLDIRQGAPVKKEMYTRGLFKLYKARLRKEIWTRGNLRYGGVKELFTKGSYRAEQSQMVYTRGSLKRPGSVRIHTKGVVLPTPPAGAARIMNLKFGDYVLTTGGVRKVRNLEQFVLDHEGLPPEVLPSPAPELPPSRAPLAKAAETLLSAAEAVRAELVPIVAGNILEIKNPGGAGGTDMVYQDGEWRLPENYSTSTLYSLSLPHNVATPSSRLLLLLLRYVPNEAIVSADLNGSLGELVLFKETSPYEECRVWAWEDPRPAVTTPWFVPNVRVRNPLGTKPGWRGLGAAILAS